MLGSSDPCAKLASLHTKPFTAVNKGDEIKISADYFAEASYSWYGPGYFSSSSQNPTVASYAEYSHEGWYYVHMSVDGCTSRTDSVYVDVKFPQGTPSCILVNNKATFSSMGDQSFYYETFGPGVYGYEVEGNSSNGDLRITMSPYWSSHALEDGIYYTTNDQLPDYADVDQIFIADVNQSIYWTAEANKPVYISHVGGKARLSFCGIQFSGDWGGTLYHTTISAQITQP